MTINLALLLRYLVYFYFELLKPTFCVGTNNSIIITSLPYFIPYFCHINTWSLKTWFSSNCAACCESIICKLLKIFQNKDKKFKKKFSTRKHILIILIFYRPRHQCRYWHNIMVKVLHTTRCTPAYPHTL
jgi:hypothetical protein